MGGGVVTDQWLWVRDGNTRVDTADLVTASLNTKTAASSVFSASDLLVMDHGGHPSYFAAAGSADPRTTAEGLQYLALLEQVRPMVTAASEAAKAAAARMEEYSSWLSQAAQIYASAEGGAQGLVTVCDALASVGCVSPSKPTSWVGWVAMGKDYFSQFKGDLQATPTLGLHAQAQMGTAAAFLNPASDDAVVSAAATVALLWRSIGTLSRPRTPGVVVMGSGGEAAWAVSPMPGGILRPSQGSKTGGGPATPLERTLQLLTSLRVDSGVNIGGAASGTPIPVPLTSASLLRRVEDSRAGGEAGQVQILKHVAGDGGISWSVVLKGTQEWVPGTRNPQDMESNFQVVARQVSDQQLSAEAAMDLAGIKPWEPVEVVGHSQGGAVALSLATSARLAPKYNFVSVLTAGAPTGTTSPPKSLSVLNVENLADAVPALDGAAAPVGKNAVTAYFDPRKVDTRKDDHAHAAETYARALEKMETENSALSEPIDQWSERRKENMGLDAGTKTEVLYFDTARVQ